MGKLTPPGPGRKPGALTDLERLCRRFPFLQQLIRHDPAAGARLARQLDGDGDQADEPAAPRERPASPQPWRQPRRKRHRSRREAIADARHRARLREAKHADKVRAKLEAFGVPPLARRHAKIIRRSEYAVCNQMIADATGRVARGYIAQLKNRVAAAAILRAAIGTDERTAWGMRPATRSRSWSDLRTRRLAATGVLMHRVSQRTKRPDRWGGGFVKGLSLGALCACLRDPFDRRPSAVPHTKTLSGTRRRRNGRIQLGYLPALIEAGFCYRQQLPAHKVPAAEVGPRGYALNRYWICSGAIELADPGSLRDVVRAMDFAARDAELLRALQAPTRAGPPSD